MNAAQYYAIASACDRLLKHPEAPFEWISNPFLHVNNQHPAILDRYERVVSRLESGQECDVASLERERIPGLASSLVRGGVHVARARLSSGLVRIGPKLRTDPVDVLLVSWLVNAAHLPNDDDFYFGDLQRRLTDRGLTSLLVLRNQTGLPTASLVGQALRNDGPCKRLLLPESSGVPEELTFLPRCATARTQLIRVAQQSSSLVDRLIAQEAIHQTFSKDVLANLRLEAQIAALCRQAQPKTLITLYEGHAWERCVWRGARRGWSPVLCVAYQHSVLWKYSHAVKRSIGSSLDCDPDLILTLGDVTRQALDESQELDGIPTMTFGTHRREADAPQVDAPTRLDKVLVLPDGTEVEAVYLVEFALQCARLLKDVRFVFRTHPILSFDAIRAKVQVDSDLPNVEVTRNARIEDDFASTGSLLYRGSSTVLYAVMAGLKPYYVARPGELNTDPLYGLSDWRERVDTVDSLAASYNARRYNRENDETTEWLRAKDFCDRYVQPTRVDALDDMLALAGLGEVRS
jgi:hypothetical protein